MVQWKCIKRQQYDELSDRERGRETEIEREREGRKREKKSQIKSNQIDKTSV